MIVFELLFLNSPYSECENSYDITKKIISGIPPAQPFELGVEYAPFLSLFKSCTSSPAINRPSSVQLLNIIKQLPSSKEQQRTSSRKQTINSDNTFVNPLYKGETLPLISH